MTEDHKSIPPLGLASTDGLGAGAEARYLASDQRPRDGGPRFRVSDAGRTISDEDFIFDAMIRVGGCYVYDGWWPESRGRTVDDAVAEACRGAGLWTPNAEAQAPTEGAQRP